MGVGPLLGEVLENDALTRGLGDPEARVLVEWLVDRIEQIEQAEPDEREAQGAVRRLCRRGRAIGRFVRLWCDGGTRSGAVQLAATERFLWPLPVAGVDPCELMQSILTWETEYLETARAWGA